MFEKAPTFLGQIWQNDLKMFSCRTLQSSDLYTNTGWPVVCVQCVLYFYMCDPSDPPGLRPHANLPRWHTLSCLQLSLTTLCLQTAVSPSLHFIFSSFSSVVSKGFHLSLFCFSCYCMCCDICTGHMIFHVLSPTFGIFQIPYKYLAFYIYIFSLILVVSFVMFKLDLFSSFFFRSLSFYPFLDKLYFYFKMIYYFCYISGHLLLSFTV